ncbi:DNA-binding transcriptional regulator, MocR family, contains an aminotransferase domain [Paenibacillus tianmuensis]|uniref:DNA-binding transcriptional regulator, MocR family, contains an aminotransferase domain n=1 Tax=Paenibacillus tianmuensis TaxID=624147 RepID=A0A1G4TYM3_9BACL|nr:PLP-dependent aminotransferase family protein [Paenibacillus tianmuensis]SCW86496.1 DNA-binding transcriptional regulator, MocR family, contains an aminotransferase domain [Paenibacillus tianmuensis]
MNMSMNMSTGCKFETIKADIQRKLASGAIRPGAKLPSIRDVAVQYGCSKNTAIRAYDELEREHLIYSVPKSGYYAVVRSEEPSSVEQLARIDLANATPDPAVMPYADFQHCLNQAIEQYQDRLFSYADPLGFMSLRQALQKHLTTAQVFTEPEQITVVSGSQQAIHLLAGMPFPNGKAAILVEQPTYFGMLHTLELLGITAIGIARSDEGIDLDELERHFRTNAIKFFYTVPRYHNPMGTSLSQEQKQAIARLAERYDVYIVEDDYLADLETKRRADPIYSLNRSGHVIYVKSFSKVTLPGLRLGTAVLPKPLLETFRQFKSSVDSSTSALSQAALELYLTCGMFDRHAVRMREHYRVRMEALRTAAARYLPQEVGLHVPDGGVFTRLLVPSPLEADDLLAALKQQNVAVSPTARSYLRTFAKDNGLRLSVMRANEAQIDEAIRRIADWIGQARRRKPSLQWDPVVDWI